MRIFYKSVITVDGVQVDSMTKLRKQTEANPFVICKTNLLQKKIHMLFAGLRSVSKGLFTWMEGAPANRATRGGLTSHKFISKMH